MRTPDLFNVARTRDVEPTVAHSPAATTFICGHWRDIDPQSFDALISDPPYGERTHTLQRNCSMSAGRHALA
jgi:23S rRNA G2445 N2-methylase RlmL